MQVRWPERGQLPTGASPGTAVRPPAAGSSRCIPSELSSTPSSASSLALPTNTRRLHGDGSRSGARQKLHC